MLGPMTGSTIPMYAPSVFAAFIGGVLLSFFNSIPWDIIFLVTQRFGVRLYIIKDKALALRIQKRLSWSSHLADGGKSYGISLGKWYYASVSIINNDFGDRYDIWMIATNASYEALSADKLVVTASSPEVGATAETKTEKQTNTKETEGGLMTFFDRVGSFQNVWFKRRVVRMASIVPRTSQGAIIDTICEHQKTHGHTVVYLHGPPGCGKSMIGIMLAQRLNASYCNTLKPWQPGDTLADLYAETDPTAEKPLLVAFDEFDGAILAIHAGIMPHKSIPISVGDKTGWNRLMDEIGRGMFPHLIVFLTSNRDPAFFHALDPSYLRAGRVDFALSVS